MSSGRTLPFRAFVTLSTASSVDEYAPRGIPCNSKEFLREYYIQSRPASTTCYRFPLVVSGVWKEQHPIPSLAARFERPLSFF